MAEKEKSFEFKITGSLVSYEYATSKFDKDDANPMHRIGIAFAEGERERLAAFCEEKGIYKDTSFIPSWFKPRKGHDNDVKFINLKSNYDFAVFYRDKNNNGEIVQTSISDITADMGSIVGSEIIATVTVKEGAIYPAALAIRKLNVQTFETFFEPEDLPFD